MSIETTIPSAPQRGGFYSRIWRRWDPGLVIILLAAFILRLYVANTAPYVHDEEVIAIPLADSISFSPASPNLPLRGPHHPALPSYVVHTSSLLFGKTPLGYRALNLVAGLLTLLVVFQFTKAWFGTSAGRWAAALLAFNEYHVGVSAYATAKAPHLLFVGLAIYAFSRFLRTQQPGGLVAAAVATALAFYCKEHSALLIVIFFLTMLHSRYRSAFRTKHVYIAVAIFLIAILPDVVWNTRTGSGGVQATYLDHLSRIGGLGFTAPHLLFFGRGAVQWVHVRVTGELIPDAAPENPSMNSIFGALFLCALLLRTLRPEPKDSMTRFLLILFWVTLGFFVLIRPGHPPKDLDDVVWYWVDVTLFPAVVVAACLLANSRGKWRVITSSVAITGMLYATVLVSMKRLTDV